MKRRRRLQPEDLGPDCDVVWSPDAAHTWVIGFDEVGMGCLAGPVVAASYAYPLIELWRTASTKSRIVDSKVLDEDERDEAEIWLRTSGALFAVCEASPEEIDRMNILRASHEAMKRCLEAIHPEMKGAENFLLLIDGSRVPEPFRRLPTGWRTQTIVKGDGKSFPIAAASILAKTHRDRLMAGLAEVHPGYGWESNVGYPTLEHKLAIQSRGPTPYHRRSFNWELSELQCAQAGVPFMSTTPVPAPIEDFPNAP